MTQFPVHTLATAPAAARPSLQAAQEKFGFVPNLIGILSEAPPAAAAYLALSQHFEATSLSPVERQVVLLSVSFDNRCDYCMAAHTVVAEMSGVPEGVIEALRTGAEVPDRRLGALAAFTRSLVRRRAEVEPEEVDRFLAAGFTRAQVLEVVLGVAMKTLSNYSNHLARTPLDAAFAKARWEAADSILAGV